MPVKPVNESINKKTCEDLIKLWRQSRVLTGPSNGLLVEGMFKCVKEGVIPADALPVYYYPQHFSPNK